MEGQMELPTKGEVEVYRSKFVVGHHLKRDLNSRGDYQKFVNIGTDFWDLFKPSTILETQPALLEQTVMTI